MDNCSNTPSDTARKTCYPRQYDDGKHFLIIVLITTQWCISIVCHLDNETRSLNGTIQPYKKDLFGNNVRRCSFYIYAPVGRRVRMTCSVVRVNPSYNYTMGWTYLKVRYSIVNYSELGILRNHNLFFFIFFCLVY